MESKYQEALDRLCENNYFDEKGNCNCDLIVMDRILLQELVDKAAPKKPFYEADYMRNKELIRLLKQHTKAQEEANCLYNEIIKELEKINIMDMPEVLSCLSNTEPLVWEEMIIKLVKGAI